jgi:hypothetical protein
VGDPLDGLPRFVVDLYVHGSPDLIERVDDDVALAASLRDTGVAAAVHRNHFGSTAERARITESVTGYPLLGAVTCADTIGGLNPVAVEYALEMGARWVTLPTLSARHHRERISNVPPSARAGVAFGPAQLRLTDDGGRLLPAVSEIVELARVADVPVNLGYSSFDECAAVLTAHRGEASFVVTNPLSTSGWSVDDLATVAAGSLFVEMTGFSHHVAAGRGLGERWLEELRAVVGAVGSDRVVLSSDSGMVGAPRSAELLATTCRRLARGGVTEDQLERFVGHTPARLVNWPELRSAASEQHQLR